MKLLNQKAKVTFFLFFYFFDRNQPMTKPSAGKKQASDFDIILKELTERDSFSERHQLINPIPKDV